MYNVVIDASHNLVDVVLSGLMTVEEVGAYIADLRRAFVMQRVRPGYRMVIDVTACPIQTQEMLAAMRDHMTAMPKASAIAVVTGSSLARMQVRRLFAQPYSRIATTVAEGRAWVLSGIEPAPVTVPATAGAAIIPSG